MKFLGVKEIQEVTVQSVVCLGTEIFQSDTRFELERKTESQTMKDSMNEHWIIFSAKERVDSKRLKENYV